MESAKYLLPLVGGMMMGVALVYLYAMLSEIPEPGRTRKAANEARWKVVAGFALGTLIGAYAISRLMQGAASLALPSVLIGMFIGGVFASVSKSVRK